VAMPLGIDLCAGLIALWRVGAVAVFPDISLGLYGLRQAIEAVRPQAFLAQGRLRMLTFVYPELMSSLQLRTQDRHPASDAIEAMADHDPAMISFTSGSTGKPKAIVRSHRVLADQSACVGSILRSAKPEIDLIAFPMFVMANLSIHGTSVLPPWNLRRPDRVSARRIASVIARHHVTRALIPPATCESLVDASGVHLNEILTGGGPIYPDLLDRLSAEVRAKDIVLIYGSTEAEPIAHQRLSEMTEEERCAMRSGGGLLAGTPIPEVRVRLVDGEIIVTGQHVNKGYLNSNDDSSTKIREGGEVWHRTGDLGRMDDEGRLWLLGRREAFANGLFPFAVEAAARSWTKVSCAALLCLNGRSVLAIEGDRRLRKEWQENSRRFGDVPIFVLRKIPKDRRHRSKIDYPRLIGLVLAASRPHRKYATRSASTRVAKLLPFHVSCDHEQSLHQRNRQHG